MKFFGQYNRFTKTGKAHDENRLNQRYEGIIKWNESWIKDKRILDIGSHDGRWAFAAIKSGAKHVTCVEPRQFYVNWTHENMKHYDVDNYDVVHGDVHEEIGNFDTDQFDLIFCLGFFYHTMEHCYLLREFKRLNPFGMIFDTNIARGEKNIIDVSWENSNSGLNAFSNEAKKCLVGRPTQSALEDMLKEHGFSQPEYFDWSSIENVPKEYISDQGVKRVTLRVKNRHIAQRFRASV